MGKKKFPTKRNVRKPTIPSRPTSKKKYREAVTTQPTDISVVEDDRGRPLLHLRSRLGMNRETFARLVPISVRHLASIESGKVPTESIQRRLIELNRVVQALNEVIQNDAIRPWLTQPNDAFEGFKPVEVIERGEVDRIWQMIFFLRSGVSF
jgi:DNA-binding transcriptional regulator YiaG